MRESRRRGRRKGTIDLFRTPPACERSARLPRVMACPLSLRSNTADLVTERCPKRTRWEISTSWDPPIGFLEGNVEQPLDVWIRERESESGMLMRNALSVRPPSVDVKLITEGPTLYTAIEPNTRGCRRSCIIRLLPSFRSMPVGGGGSGSGCLLFSYAALRPIGPLLIFEITSPRASLRRLRLRTDVHPISALHTRHSCPMQVNGEYMAAVCLSSEDARRVLNREINTDLLQ